MTRWQAIGLMAGVVLGLALSYAPNADAARNGGGTYSLPASVNPVRDGGLITSNWANTTLNDIATELTSSLDRSGRGAMLAALRLSAGSVGSPGLTFSSETSSGLYRAGSGDIRLGVSGADVQKWTSSAVTLSTGLVCTASAANGTGTISTGLGNGSGVTGYGGASNSDAGVVNGAGVVGSGGALGYGVVGLGGTGTPGTVRGLAAIYGKASDNHGGQGAILLGAATTDGGEGGTGLSVSAGASTYGVGGTAVYAAAGVGSSVANAGIGVNAIAGEASTSTARSTAIQLGNGDIYFSSPVAPAVSTSINNRVTAANTIKAWGNIQAGSSTPWVEGGFNISGTSCADAGTGTCVSCTSKVITVNIAQDFSSANYACTASGQSWGYSCSCFSAAAGSLQIGCADIGVGQLDLCATSTEVNFIAVGSQ